MKAFLILIFSLSFSLTAFGQADSIGFTNKAEAKNLIVHGLKEGKWVEPLDYIQSDPSDTLYSPYQYTIYHAGKPFGLQRIYDEHTRKLDSEIPYLDGYINGVVKEYYSNGNLKKESFYIDNYPRGFVKEYYSNGKLKSETDSSSGITKTYDENGNEIK